MGKTPGERIHLERKVEMRAAKSETDAQAGGLCAVEGATSRDQRNPNLQPGSQQP